MIAAVVLPAPCQNADSAMDFTRIIDFPMDFNGLARIPMVSTGEEGLYFFLPTTQKAVLPMLF